MCVRAPRTTRQPLDPRKDGWTTSASGGEHSSTVRAAARAARTDGLEGASGAARRKRGNLQKQSATTPHMGASGTNRHFDGGADGGPCSIKGESHESGGGGCSLATCSLSTVPTQLLLLLLLLEQQQPQIVCASV